LTFCPDYAYIISMDTKIKELMTQEVFQEIASKPLPKAEELFLPLTKWHSTLYDAFGYSFTRTREVLRNTHNRKSTRMFRPQAIRFFVHDFLSQKGVKAQLVDKNDDIEEESEDEAFQPRVLPSNGIAGSINGYEYRVLNMYKGGLPPPVSPKRIEYYNQPHLKGYKQLLPGLEDYTDYKAVLKPNLIYLWNIVKNRVDLYLAIPKHSTLYATTEVALIPNPIISIKQVDIEEEIHETKNHIEVKQKNDLRRANQTSA